LTHRSTDRAGSVFRITSFSLALGLLAGCSAGEISGAPPGPSGGEAGSGGTTLAPGAGGSSGSGGARLADSGEGGATPDAGPTGADATSYPTGPVDYGGVGEEPLVPLAYTPEPVPPIIPMDCPNDPTEGYTEYRDSFVIQRPYDLAASDRFKYENGIYTLWVFPHDKSHATWSGTHSRTETRYSDIKTGEHIWTGDVMVESGSENVCIFQVKGALGPLGIYLRVNGGNVHELGGSNFLNDIYDKWFNLKAAWDSETGTGRVWINNCLKLTVHNQKGSIFYFKHGTYTCNSTVCRDHFKNIHLYQKGSTDEYNVKSPIR
jgi:hypothetical protein